MIVSPGRNYVFVHIPKTGGTALSLALEARAMKDDILIGDTPKARRRRNRLRDVQTHGRLWKHSTLADIEGLVPGDVLDRLLAFTLVRNPWDRAVSYYHWLRAQRFDHPAVALSRSLPFTVFAAHPVVAAGFSANPAASYLRRPGGTDRDALYIRLEHFRTDAAPLFDHLGFRFDLVPANRSDRAPDYRPYFDAAATDAIAASCAEDIAKFGYRFDDPGIDQAKAAKG